MNPAQLLAHFDRISEAPDAVPRLRRFILDLAVRGRLVEQDPAESPVSALLTSPEDVGSPSAGACEALFDIPDSWAWVEIRRAAQVEMGQSPPSEHYNTSGEGLPFF